MRQLAGGQSCLLRGVSSDLPPLLSFSVGCWIKFGLFPLSVLSAGQRQSDISLSRQKQTCCSFSAGILLLHLNPLVDQSFFWSLPHLMFQTEGAGDGRGPNEPKPSRKDLEDKDVTEHIKRDTI